MLRYVKIKLNDQKGPSVWTMIPLSRRRYLDEKLKRNASQFCSITVNHRGIHIIRKMERKQSERRYPTGDNLISVRHKYVISEPVPYRPASN